ncbi:MAG TPA: glycosyltransferase family 2 protein [Syntrophales bacterium]|nr:glycosyltransferase family 2 protein [Syntrophales bacterium]
MNNTGTFLSIIVPTFNYGHMLRRSLESVLSQMTGECELVVVDDGSTDNTSELLVELSADYPVGFHWIRQDNAGAAAARNRGLCASYGRHILFLDADDELLPGALDAICSTFHDDLDATVVIGGRITRWPNGREKHHKPPLSLDVNPCRRVADYLLHKKISVSHGAVAVRRSLIERRTYPESFRSREDIPVSAYWLAYGNIKTISSQLVLIHKHPDSLRHRGKVSEPIELELAEEIFLGLPKECQGLKRAFLAQRYLSLSRISAASGEVSTARRFLIMACRLDCAQLLVQGQLRKLLSSWLGMLFR